MLTYDELVDLARLWAYSSRITTDREVVTPTRLTSF
jgi:hypothetical protein